MPLSALSCHSVRPKSSPTTLSFPVTSVETGSQREKQSMTCRDFHSKSGFWHSHSGPGDGEFSVPQLLPASTLLTAQQQEEGQRSQVPVQEAGWGDWARKGGRR